MKKNIKKISYCLLCLYTLPLLNLPAYSENIIIENHIHVDNSIPDYIIENKNIKMMKIIGARQWIMQNEKATVDYYNIGLKQFSNGKYDDCIKSLEHAKKFYWYKDVFDTIHHLMGLSYFNKKDYINAIKYFNYAINNYGLKIAQIYYERGLARYYIQDYSGAIGDFDIAYSKKLDPKDTVLVTKNFLDYKTIITNTERSNLYIDKNLDISLDVFQLIPMENTAIKLTTILNSKNINIHSNENTTKNIGKANKLFNDNISQDTIATYDEILKLNPNLAEAYNNRGILKFKKKEYKAAIDDFKKALKIKPNYEEIVYNLALCQYQNGDYDTATINIDNFLQLQRHIPVKRSSVQSFMDFILGVEDFEKNDKAYRYYIAQIIKANALLFEDKIEEAAKIYNNTEFISIHQLGYSFILLKNKEYSKAIKGLKSFLDFEHKTVNYYGKEYEEKTLDLSVNAYIYNNIAFAEYLRGNYIKSYENIQKAKYVAFSTNNINLYNKIVKLENTIKSHLTQQDEDKINKEYNKFYNRNEEARKYKT